jgi:molecular chaperone IbpA
VTKLFPYGQFGIGFEHMFDQLERLMSMQANAGYPPYNVEHISDTVDRITMAVAGFSEDEIEITHNDNVLLVHGQKSEDLSGTFAYKGIAKRNFRKEFVLANRVEVKTAILKDGLLIIDFEKLAPVELAPKKITLFKV